MFVTSFQSSIFDGFRMANTICSAESGSDWTAIELTAYNIRVKLQDVSAFFGTPRLPEPVLTPAEVLKGTGPNQGYALLRILDMAVSISLNKESAVDDFVMALFRACGYARRGRVV